MTRVTVALSPRKIFAGSAFTLAATGLHFDGRVGQLWQLGLKFAQVSDVPLETVAFAAIRRFGRNF